MSLNRLMDTPCTIVRAALVTDRYGATVPDWDDTTTADTICWVNDTSTNEAIDGRDTVTTRWLLYLPPNTDITSFDRVQIAGDTYFVDGNVSQASRPNKGVHHLECKLLLVVA